MEFIFEDSPLDIQLASLKAGETISALRFLALTEDEDEASVDSALTQLEQHGVALDVTDLPPAEVTGATAARLKQETKFTCTAQLLTQLEENDPLRVYLEELACVPAAGDVHLLAEQLLSGQDTAQQLAALCLSRVVDKGLEMTGRGVLLLDLIQEGSLGLWQGILQYAGGDFESHCDWWIHQYMAKAVLLCYRNSGFGQKLRQGMEDYTDVDQRLLTELGRNPTLEEIAEQMHVSPEQAAAFAQMIADARAMRRIHPEENPQDTQEQDQSVENTAYFQSRQRILELLSVLDEQEAELLTLRFGLEGGAPLTPQQTGARLGLSADEVVTREAVALAKLRGEN